jgi:hypothetical protein
MTLETFTPSDQSFPSDTTSVIISGWADGIDGNINVTFTTGTGTITYLTPLFGPWVVALDDLVPGDYEVEITQDDQIPWTVSFTILALSVEEAGGTRSPPGRDPAASWRVE